MRAVNVASCALGELLEQGEFRYAAFDLTERLGARVMGATVYEMQAGAKRGPYHYHHGVEEWLYVVSGLPVLRDPNGERTLEPGDLVAFESGPMGAHTVHGPGRIVMFSTGARGWGEAFVTVYPDWDKIGAAPGVLFRRADAIDAWPREAGNKPRAADVASGSPPQPDGPIVNLLRVAADAVSDDQARDGSGVREARLGAILGGQTWTATLHELALGEAAAEYLYEWCREEWVLVLSGAPTLRHADGEDVLRSGDILCFPEGPTGARRILNESQEVVRVIAFSSPVGRPLSAFFPDSGTVLVRISDYEGFLFRHDDQIEDDWDGEPGAPTA